MKYQITEGEFKLLLESRQIMEAMIEMIDDYKVFTEDPTGLYGELDYSVSELEKKAKMLVKINAGLKEQALR